MENEPHTCPNFLPPSVKLVVNPLKCHFSPVSSSRVSSSMITRMSVRRSLHQTPNSTDLRGVVNKESIKSKLFGPLTISTSKVIRLLLGKELFSLGKAENQPSSSRFRDDPFIRTGISHIFNYTPIQIACQVDVLVIT